MQTVNCSWGALPLLAVLLISSCATPPEAPTYAEITDEVAVEAIILSVDKTSRELTLRRPDGTSVVVVAGPEVRNFDQIEAGNKVSARYTVSLSARRLAPEEPSAQPTAEVAAARAKPGELPGAAVGAGVAVTVVVKSVDLEANVVVLTDPDGVIHAVEAEREEGQRFITGLKPGDRVELIYKAALVLAVE